MSRDIRPSRSEIASGLGAAREGGMFDSLPQAESIQCGCSMLSQIRLRPRNPGAFALMRCSLGYALRGDEAVAKCLAVEGPAECWKSAQNWRVNLPESSPPTSDPRHVAGIADTTEEQLTTANEAPEGKVVGVMVEGTVEVIEVVHTRIVTARSNKRRRSR